MRYKPIPPAPPTPAIIRDAQKAIPLVPAQELDCCTRLMDRVGVPSRDIARTWISFLQALDLVESGELGYTRTHTEVSGDELAAAFLSAIYGAREAIEVIETADSPVPRADIVTALADIEPHWEQHRDHPPDTWEARTDRLLDWLTLLGLITKTPDGYEKP